jgi:general secretion pathway protein A
LGEYYAVWRTPTPIPGNLRVSDTGQAVDWLRDRLIQDKYLALGAEAGPTYFDERIESAVRQLQTTHGLSPDGIVGPETLFALLANSDEGPRLRRLRQ